MKGRRKQGATPYGRKTTMTDWLDNEDSEAFVGLEDMIPDSDILVPDQTLPTIEAQDMALETNRTVTFAGREFEIDEPDMATVLALLNWAGMLGVRANRFAGQSFKGLFIEEGRDGKKTFVPPAETTLFAMLSVVSPSDIGRLAIIAFFGGGKDAEKAGRDWLGAIDEKDMKIAPLVKALAIRIALAEDLREALKNLQIGAAMTSLLQKANPK